MPFTIEQAAKLTDKQIARLTRKQRDELDDLLDDFLRRDSQANQIIYYKPVNPEAMKLHLSSALEFGVQGGNKSGKTGTLLAEMAIQMTGVVPYCLEGKYPPEKLRTPIRCRLVVSSLVNAWDINLKLKFQYFHWNGQKNPDGLVGDPDFGHWGWIPQRFLINGDWDQSWSEKHRVLTLENGSTLQVMSHDQSVTDFNQGAFHLVVEDEIPPEEIHRANKTRVIELGGRIITGGTPPDDRSNAVTAAWFYDQILSPGMDGSNPEETGAAVLWTEHNRTLPQKFVAFLSKGLTPEQRESRMHGKSLHLSGLILPGFKERPMVWCARCSEDILPMDGKCPTCSGTDILTYSNLWGDADMEWPGPAGWPTLFYMDPHQARPTACAWFKIDRQNGWWQVAELDVPGDAETVKQTVMEYERAHKLTPFWRKGDPKITAQTNQFAREFGGQSFSIRTAFEECGFWFEDANTNFTVGRERILSAFRPNHLTRTPKLRIHENCVKTRYAVTHFTWDMGARMTNMDVKDKPGKKNSDFPALLRYMANDDPTWMGIHAVRAGEVLHVGGGGVGRNKRTGW